MYPPAASPAEPAHDPQPSLAQRERDNARLTLVAHGSASYAPRTRNNAATAELTLAFAVDFTTAGERLTRKAAAPRNDALPLAIDDDPLCTARAVYRLVALQRRARILNIAGNGLHTLAHHGITQDALNRWLYGVLAPVHGHHPIERILSGGQTGVDTAGLVVALALGIAAVGTLPKGFLRRSAEGVDTESSEAALRAELLVQVERLRASVARASQP